MTGNIDELTVLLFKDFKVASSCRCESFAKKVDSSHFKCENIKGKKLITDDFKSRTVKKVMKLKFMCH